MCTYLRQLLQIFSERKGSETSGITQGCVSRLTNIAPALTVTIEGCVFQLRLGGSNCFPPRNFTYWAEKQSISIPQHVSQLPCILWLKPACVIVGDSQELVRCIRWLHLGHYSLHG
jgi:hypothetical protein